MSGPPGDPRDPAPPGFEDETIVDETRVRPGARDEPTVVEREVRRRRRRPDELWPWLLGLLVVVLAGIAAFWYFTRDETKPVPDVTGSTLEQAVDRLQDEGFKVDIERGNDDAPVGTVFDQDPAAGEEADEGSTVRISVSEGPRTAQVPAVVGTSEENARSELEDAGFEARVVQVFSDQPEGSVVAQAPTALDEAPVGSTVRINVSKGTGRTTVPNVVGLGENEAKQELGDAKLKANVVSVPSAEQADTVVAQSPAAGADVQQDSVVRLNVSSGEGGTTPTETEPTTTTPTEPTTPTTTG